MADGFLSGVFDRAGDLLDNISGKTDSKNLQAQLANQQLLNDKIIALQQQEIAFKESPEYLAAKQKKIYVAAFVLIVCIVCAFFIIRKS